MLPKKHTRKKHTGKNKALIATGLAAIGGFAAKYKHDIDKLERTIVVNSVKCETERTRLKHEINELTNARDECLQSQRSNEQRQSSEQHRAHEERLKKVVADAYKKCNDEKTPLYQELRDCHTQTQEISESLKTSEQEVQTEKLKRETLERSNAEAEKKNETLRKRMDEQIRSLQEQTNTSQKANDICRANYSKLESACEKNKRENEKAERELKSKYESEEYARRTANERLNKRNQELGAIHIEQRNKIQTLATENDRLKQVIIQQKQTMEEVKDQKNNELKQVFRREQTQWRLEKDQMKSQLASQKVELLEANTKIKYLESVSEKASAECIMNQAIVLAVFQEFTKFGELGTDLQNRIIAAVEEDKQRQQTRSRASHLEKKIKQLVYTNDELKKALKKAELERNRRMAQ